MKKRRPKKGEQQSDDELDNGDDENDEAGDDTVVDDGDEGRNVIIYTDGINLKLFLCLYAMMSLPILNIILNNSNKHIVPNCKLSVMCLFMFFFIYIYTTRSVNKRTAHLMVCDYHNL